MTTSVAGYYQENTKTVKTLIVQKVRRYRKQWAEYIKKLVIAIRFIYFPQKSCIELEPKVVYIMRELFLDLLFATTYHTFCNNYLTTTFKNNYNSICNRN